MGDDLTDRIIGAAIEVHRRLGTGFLESVYEKALHIELSKRNIPFSSQHRVIVQYDGIAVGTHIFDLLFEDKFVVELKAVSEIEKVHFAVVRSYLKSIDEEHGLILNFGKPIIDIKRVIRRRYTMDEE